MKVRDGFVSNSSSSSFVVRLDDLTAKQLNQIENHIYFGRKVGIEYCMENDAWSIEVDHDANEVRGYTYMDNFDMYAFMKKIGVTNVDWGGEK